MSDYQGAEGWDAVQAGLAAVVTDHGRRISEDAGRLRAALSDQLGAAGHTYRSLADAVVVAAEEHIPADLIAGASGQPARPYAELLGALTTRGFAQPLAATVIERWRAVLVEQRSGPPAPAPATPAATAPPLVPPVIPPVVPPVVPPVPPPPVVGPPVPTLALDDASAPTHLAGQGFPAPAPWSEPQPGSMPTQPKGPASPSRRYVALFVGCLLLVAAAGGLIWFQHRGTDTAGPGTPSTSGPPNGSLSAPSGLAASTGAGTVSLTWQSVDGATTYVVTRDGTTISGANLRTTSFTDTLTDTSAHTYTVAAVNSTGPGPTTAVSASADAVIPSTGPSGTGLSSAEAALVARLPTSAVDTATCKAYSSGEDEDADASVTCSSHGTDGSPPTSIFAYHYVTAAAQAADTQSSIDLAKLTEGSCTTAPPAAAHWHLGDAPDTTVGALLCYDYNQTHVVRWDYDTSQVSIEGWGSDGTLADRISWWMASAGPLR